MTPEQHHELRRKFPAETVGKLPRGGTKLDFVGHAAVTDRLLSVDPEWNWEPLAYDANGLPARDAEGALWIKLTVGGVTRLGVSDPGDTNKVAIGDALRNAAMRFGVALDLWTKDELESQVGESSRQVRQGSGAPHTPGDHEDAKARATIGGFVQRWQETDAAWRISRLREMRASNGWPDSLHDYSRAQLAQAVKACADLDREPFPVDTDPQDGPGEAQLALDGAGGADQQGEGVAVAPGAANGLSAKEPAAAPEPAARGRAKK